MKTPDEIKKGLACDTQRCDGCPYDEIIECGVAVQEDALAYIQQLESRLAQAERERDAAVRDMHKAVVCDACKHDRPFNSNCKNDFDCEYCKSPCMCQSCHLGSNYEWRGVCAENTMEE